MNLKLEHIAFYDEEDGGKAFMPLFSKVKETYGHASTLPPMSVSTRSRDHMLLEKLMYCYLYPTSVA